MMIPLRTFLTIPAPPEKVWAVLSDMDSWHEWNPLMISGKGKPAVGMKTPMVAKVPNSETGKLKVTAVILEAEPNKSLAWTSDSSLAFLFNGRHYFRLSPEGAGTRLEHGEDFSGLLPTIWGKKGIDKFVPAYEALNHALAARVAQTS